MAGGHFRNASWSGLAAAIRAATGLLSTLLAIRLVGASGYGQVATWLSLFVLYLSLNSSVFTALVVRLMAAGGQDAATDRDEASATAAKFCLWSLAVLGIATVLLSALTARWPTSGREPAAAVGDTILLLGLLTGTQILVALQAALVEAAGRLDLATKWQLVGPLTIMLMLAAAYATGARLAADAYVAVLCAGSIIDLILVWRLRRELALSLAIRGGSANGVRDILLLLRSGGLLQATSLLNLFLEPVNKFLLNHFVGAAAVAIYDLAMKVVWGIQYLVGAAMRVFLHIGSRDSSAVARVFARAITLLGVPVVAMHILGVLFLFWAARYWLTLDAAQLLVFFAIATLSNLGMIFVTPLYLSLIGRGELAFVFRTQAVLAAVNVVTSSLAIPVLGLAGAALGLLAATLVNGVAIYRRCRIDSAVFDDPETPAAQTLGRVLLALSLLAATMAWAASGGHEPAVLLPIVACLAAIVAREPLLARMAEQFFPRRQ